MKISVLSIVAFELVVREVLEVFQTAQVIVFVLGCQSQLDGNTPLLAFQGIEELVLN